MGSYVNMVVSTRRMTASSASHRFAPISATERRVDWRSVGLLLVIGPPQPALSSPVPMVRKAAIYHYVVSAGQSACDRHDRLLG
jgi:hypothetical protein